MYRDENTWSELLKILPRGVSTLKIARVLKRRRPFNFPCTSRISRVHLSRERERSSSAGVGEGGEGSDLVISAGSQFSLAPETFKFPPVPLVRSFSPRYEYSHLRARAAVSGEGKRIKKVKRKKSGVDEGKSEREVGGNAIYLDVANFNSRRSYLSRGVFSFVKSAFFRFSLLSFGVVVPFVFAWNFARTL